MDFQEVPHPEDQVVLYAQKILTVMRELPAFNLDQTFLCVFPEILFQRIIITSSILVYLTRLRYRSIPITRISFGVVSVLVEQAVIKTGRIVKFLTAAAMVRVVAHPVKASPSQLLRLSLHWQKKEVTFMTLKSSTALPWVFQ